METIRFEQREHIGIVTLDRPDVLNAMNDAMRAELRTLCEELDQRGDVWVVVFAGSDRAFSAGADVKGADETDTTPTEFWRYKRRGAEVFPIVARLSQPTIAAISGWCLGGGLELALACDMRVASPTAQLGLTEARLGSIPAGGGTQRLSRLVGAGFAAELMLTGRRISADRALAIGLVNAVSDDWFEAALELAGEVATAAPVAVQLIKEALWSGLDASFQSGLSTEFLAAALAFGADDRVEGMRAFAEKRTPKWAGIRNASSEGAARRD